MRPRDLLFTFSGCPDVAQVADAIAHAHLLEMNSVGDLRPLARSVSLFRPGVVRPGVIALALRIVAS